MRVSKILSIKLIFYKSAAFLVSKHSKRTFTEIITFAIDMAARFGHGYSHG